MTDDVRISVGLPSHHKTRKLKRRLGPDGCWSLVVLFLWAGAQRWDGSLHGMQDEDIELAADWDGDPGAFVCALLDVGFLDGDAGLRSIHDWQEHNPYAASKGERIEKGRQAAEARWRRKKGRPADSSDATSMPSACYEHATTTAEQCPPAPTPTLPVRAKATVEPAARQRATANRFDEFWSAYPNRKGKQEAAKRWRREGLDAMADTILAHVAHMRANDDDWLRGFAPMGSTYLNQSRWTDEARPPPLADGQAPAPAKERVYGAAAAMVPSESKADRDRAYQEHQRRLGLNGDAP